MVCLHGVCFGLEGLVREECLPWRKFTSGRLYPPNPLPRSSVGGNHPIHFHLERNSPPMSGMPPVRDKGFHGTQRNLWIQHPPHPYEVIHSPSPTHAEPLCLEDTPPPLHPHTRTVRSPFTHTHSLKVDGVPGRLRILVKPFHLEVCSHLSVTFPTYGTACLTVTGGAGKWASCAGAEPDHPHTGSPAGTPPQAGHHLAQPATAHPPLKVSHISVHPHHLLRHDAATSLSLRSGGRAPKIVARGFHFSPTLSPIECVRAREACETATTSPVPLPTPVSASHFSRAAALATIPTSLFPGASSLSPVVE